MSQRNALQALDDTIVAALGAVGLADLGLYQSADAAPGADPVPCTVLVDRDVQLYGADNDPADVATYKIVATLFLADIPAPVRGSRLVVDGEEFLLDFQLKRDESRSVWVLSDA